MDCPWEDLGTDHLREWANAKAQKWDRFGALDMHWGACAGGGQAWWGSSVRCRLEAAGVWEAHVLVSGHYW